MVFGETIKRDGLWFMACRSRPGAKYICAFCDGKLENWVTFDGDFT